MNKKLIFGAVLVLVVASVAVAQTNQIRDLNAGITANVLIATCQPETSGPAAEWDKTPTLGNWGGLDESQFAVVWEPGFNDTPASRMASCYISNTTTMVPLEVRVRVLQGLANDDYCLFASVGAGNLLIGCIDETSATEVWVTDTFILPAGAFAAGQDVKITLMATGNAWPSFSAYGQLAVDYIQLLGL